MTKPEAAEAAAAVEHRNRFRPFGVAAVFAEVHAVKCVGMDSSFVVVVVTGHRRVSCSTEEEAMRLAAA